MTQHLNEIWCVARDLDNMADAFLLTGNDKAGVALSRMADRLDDARLAITTGERLDREHGARFAPMTAAASPGDA